LLNAGNRLALEKDKLFPIGYKMDFFCL